MPNQYLPIRTPKADSITVANGSIYSDNVVQFTVDEVNYLSHSTLLRSNSNTDIQYRLNGDPEAVYTLPANETAFFMVGDVDIWQIEFQNVVSGGTDVDVDIQACLLVAYTVPS